MSVAPSIEPLHAAPAVETTGLLFERHAALLLAFCLRRLGTREEAEDAVQQTFMKAFRAVRDGFTPAAEKAWLYRIAENVCTDRLRSAAYRRRHESSPEELAGVAAPSDRRGLEGMGAALAGLGEHQRRALVLREWHGLSYREIARELDISQSAVETLLFRARRTLARKLEAFSFAGWLKSALAGGGAAKAAAAAVATISVVALALPPAVDRLRERPEPSRPPRAPAVVDPHDAPTVVPTVARSPRSQAGNTESRASTRPPFTAEEPRPEPRSAPPAAANSPEAGASSSETQSPVPAPAVEAVTPALPEPPVLPELVPVPAVPEVTLPVPEVTVPAPEDVLEPVGAVVPELPALPTLP